MNENNLVKPDATQNYDGNKFSKENILALSDAVAQNKEILNRSLDLATQITDVYAESQRLNAQVEIVKENSKVALAAITARFLTTRQIIEETFKERRFALNASYEVLQKGIDDNNTDLILAGMREIGKVVVTSPLQDIQEFARRFNDTSQPLLDF